MHEANLTRFGPETYALVRGKPTTYKAAFNAIVGPAKLILHNQGLDAAWITINGQAIVSRETFDAHSNKSELVVELTLGQKNLIEVTVPGLSEGASSESLGVRITQITKADIGLLRQGYFGLNTSSMERQRAFYDTLGFIGEIYPAGPETSTTFAQSLGFPEDYLIHVALTSLENPPMPPFVDTVEFRGESYRDEPPYAQLNHLGMAYATFSTTDVDGDYVYLKDKGIDFVSEPADAPNGERFVFFRDQDGAYLKLTQADGASAGSKADSAPNLVRLFNTNMNVSDMERSREFYRLLGFSEAQDQSQAGSGAFAAAHGFDGSIEFKGQDISLGEGTDGATLQLRQWTTPYDGEAPYPPPVNHLGIDRINFYVKDLTASVKAMTELGFEQMSSIGGSSEIGIVFFFDPDGIKVQLAGPQSAE